MTEIKICGLTRECDIDAVNTAKPDYIGFVFAESRRKVTPKQASVLKQKLSPEITTVGVFVNESIENIISLVRLNIIGMVQLHGDEDEAYINTLKSHIDAPLIKAVSVINTGDAQKWTHTRADYLLLDNKTGGAGQAFDWHLIGETGRPFFLAGGINVNNVKTAIQTVSPFAVDVSSGVETGGVKDANKITEIIRSIRNG